jgi:hypothetical protein
LFQSLGLRAGKLIIPVGKQPELWYKIVEASSTTKLGLFTVTKRAVAWAARIVEI